LNRDSILRLEKVTVGHGGRAVLTNLSLEFRRGELTGLLGANGSGKSTLLRSILGILPLLAGRMIWGTQAGRRPVIGYVPQQETLDPIFPLSGFAVALQGAGGRTRPGRWIPRAEREWTRKCLTQTGAAEFAASLFSELSGGQKQRVLIARALATRPDLLVLDEPASGLDAGAAQSLMELLGRVRKDGLAILMVSHDLAAIRSHAQQIVWLRDGVAQQGPTAALLTRERIEDILAMALD
jgi:ABC-type Mn2+/Zn2+ transport system ATPase subunit